VKRTLVRYGAAILSAVTTFTLCPSSRAQQGGTAQELYELAINKEIPAKDFTSARRHLEEVVRLVPDGFGGRSALAYCYENLGLLASAWAMYGTAESIAEVKGPITDRDDARARMAALRPRLARLSIKVPEAVRKLPELEIQRDGLSVGAGQWDVPLPLDKGRHVITVIARGKQRWEVTVEINDEGSTQSVVVPALVDVPPPSRDLIEPPPFTPPPTSRPITLDLGVRLGPSVRLSDAPPLARAERPGLGLGAYAFLAPNQWFALGLMYEHTELGGEQSGPPDPNSAVNKLDVSRHIDTLWAGLRLQFLNAERVRVSALFAAGPAWQDAYLDGVVLNKEFSLTSKSCTIHDGPHPALRGGLSGEFLLGNGVYFQTDVNFDNMRLSNDMLDDCVQGAGTVNLVAVHVGFGYRFDLR
jgi:hypothetical protein